MPWKNIQRNLTTGKTIALVGNTNTSGSLYAIVNNGNASPAQFWRMMGAASGGIWGKVSPNLPDNAQDIIVSGFAHDPDNNKIYVVNSKLGKVYIYNIAANTWATDTNLSWNDHTGINARLRQIVYNDHKLYLAHLGGVSSLSTSISGTPPTWTLAAQFISAQYGDGECTGLTVQNNSVYVTVENYTAVYKNNNTLTWDKVAILPPYSVNPQYMAPGSFTNSIFVTADDINTNLYSTDKIESNTTAEPTFSDGMHLGAPASSILTSKVDNVTWVTTASGSHATETINAFGANLITAINNDLITIDNSSERISNVLHDAGTASAYNTVTVDAPEAPGKIISTIVPADHSISIQSTGIALHVNNMVEYTRTYYTDAMTLLPNVKYTLTFGAVGSSQIAFVTGGALNYGAYFKVDVGIDGSPNHTSFNPNIAPQIFDLSDSVLVPTGTYRGTPVFINQASTANLYEFSLTNTQSQTPVRLRIVVHYAIVSPGANMTTFIANHQHTGTGDAEQDWAFSLMLKNVVINRKDATALIGKTQYSPAYSVQNFAQVPQVDQALIQRNLISAPTPPDNWFIRFNAPNTDAVAASTFKYSQIIRQVKLNPMTLKANTAYQMGINVLRDRAINSSATLKVTITPSLAKLQVYQAAISSSDPYPITFKFTTPNLTPAELQNLVFTLKAFEENATLGEAAPVLFSDITFFELSSGSPKATVYRIKDGSLDNVYANTAVTSSNVPVTLGDTYNLIETWEANSNAYRKYMISAGDIYAWEVDNNDPFDASHRSKCIICC